MLCLKLFYRLFLFLWQILFENMMFPWRLAVGQLSWVTVQFPQYGLIPYSLCILLLFVLLFLARLFVLAFCFLLFYINYPGTAYVEAEILVNCLRDCPILSNWIYTLLPTYYVVVFVVALSYLFTIVNCFLLF